MTNKPSPRYAIRNRDWRKALSLPLVLACLLIPLLALQATSAVADQDASGWHIEPVGSEAGEYISLALDEGGYPHISYYCQYYYDPNYHLKYAYQDAAGWHIGIVDSGGRVGKRTSLALDGGGYAHISYYAYPPHSYPDLKYAYQDASGWHTETVDNPPGVDQHTSLAVDGDGHPHISYCAYQPDTYWDLKYAYQDVSGWHIETVDSEGNVGYDNSLALDRDGYPHISYTGGGLKYAYQDASGWHIETVDREGRVGEYNSLDGDGYPHISYFDATNDDLKYAYQDDSGWYVQTVDTWLGYYGGHTSLALDGDGYPHISYHGSNDLSYHGSQDLKYAYQDASGWHIQTVDSEGNVGKFTSLALDGDGHPHISYYDYANRDLKYAYYQTSHQVYLPIILILYEE